MNAPIAQCRDCGVYAGPMFFTRSLNVEGFCASCARSAMVNADAERAECQAVIEALEEQIAARRLRIIRLRVLIDADTAALAKLRKDQLRLPREPRDVNAPAEVWLSTPIEVVRRDQVTALRQWAALHGGRVHTEVAAGDLDRHAGALRGALGRMGAIKTGAPYVYRLPEVGRKAEKGEER